MSELVDRVTNSMEAAYRLESKIAEEVFEIQGWSSSRIRHFLNNLCSYPKTRYLEVGVWFGSTYISALYGNNVDRATAIDNFSQHWDETGYPQDELEISEYVTFKENCESFLGESPNIINKDFLSAIKELKGTYNVYFYDGDHSIKSQEQALLRFWPKLAKEFVFIVDDWNSEDVQKGTNSALEKMKGKVIQRWEFPTDSIENDGWWNGLAIYVIRKD